MNKSPTKRNNGKVNYGTYVMLGSQKVFSGFMNNRATKTFQDQIYYNKSLSNSKHIPNSVFY